MAVHKPITKPGIYFITFTCFRWFNLIDITQGYDLIYYFFDMLVKANHAICGYVIMPNHVHLIMYYAGGKKSLNTIIGNGKRFIGYQIVKRLTTQGNVEILSTLKKAVRPSDRRRGKAHEIWEDTFDIKECRTEAFLLQKLHYIHENPCAPRWKLVEESHQYPHSSALQYLNGRVAKYRIQDYREFIHMYYSPE